MSLKEEFDVLVSDFNTTPEDINTWVNHNIEYVEDRVLHDKEEYWSRPDETLSLGAGDCEDIAILKWHACEKLMISGIKLAYCLMPGSLPHVVVLHNDDVLDNRTDEIYPLQLLGDLKIVFTFDRFGVYINGLKISEIDRLPVWKELLNKP